MGTTLRLHEFNLAEYGWRRAQRQRDSGQARTRATVLAERQMEHYAQVLKKLGATRTRDGWML